jgi:hypothetical protein
MIKQRLPQKGTPDKAQPRDLFSTPNYAVDILIPFIPNNILQIWECAAGDGKISIELETCSKHYTVISTDIRGKSFTFPSVYYNNFLTDPKPEIFDFYGFDNIAIITNPPYSLKRQFFNKCIEYDIPFALLISGDYSLWTIDAIRKYGCEKLVPDHRINYITPTGLSEATGHTSYFHSYWLTRYFNLGKSEMFVELTNEMKRNI